MIAIQASRILFIICAVHYVDSSHSQSPRDEFNYEMADIAQGRMPSVICYSLAYYRSSIRRLSAFPILKVLGIDYYSGKPAEEKLSSCHCLNHFFYYKRSR